MRAADFHFEVGDRVIVDHGAWTEDGEITHIPDGAEVLEVEVKTNDDEAYGFYRPEDIKPWRVY